MKYANNNFKPQARSGMSLREAKRLLRELGGVERHVHATGEIQFTHPACERPSARINNRQHDTPRHAVVYLRDLEALLHTLNTKE